MSDPPVQPSCKACGYGFLRSAFEPCCSARCADYLAAVGPDKATQARRDDPFADRPRFGPVGQFIACAGCGLRFESRGLRYCPDCYLVLGDPVERKTPSAAARAVRKQVCQGCGGDLPAYLANGRNARQATVFCSDACRARAHRSRTRVTDNRPIRREVQETQLSVTRSAETRAPRAAVAQDQAV
jgi:hypothetical protein